MTTLLDPAPSAGVLSQPAPAAPSAPPVRNGSIATTVVKGAVAAGTAFARASRPAPGFPPFPTRRFTVDEYHRLVETGILADDEPVELLEGWILPKMPHSPLHDGTIGRLSYEASPLVPPNWRTRIQSAVSIGDSEPGPDYAVVRQVPGDYLRSHPTPADIGLLVEVAESSLPRDRLKCPIYARARVAVYWIVNLAQNQIEVYTEPSGSDDDAHYARRTDYRPGERIPFVLDGQELGSLAIDAILPPQA